MSTRDALVSLLVVLASGAAQAQPASLEVEGLDDVIVPLVEQRAKRTLDDTRYEKKIMAAVKGHKVAPLWSLGFALRRKPIGSRAVRVRHEVKGVAMVLPPLVWPQHATATIGMPVECSFGCCGFEDPGAPKGGVYVSKACFTKGELTDLDFGTIATTKPDTNVPELFASEAIPKWLAGSDRVSFATALAADAPAQNVSAIRAATTRPIEVAAWRAVTAFASKPTAVELPFVAVLHDRKPRPTRTKVASWNALLSTMKSPPSVGTPYVCLGRCCLFTQAEGLEEPALRDACFDERDRLVRVNVDVSGDRAALASWILNRVAEDAKASNWSPATRVDACLAAALAPQNLAAMQYCAQRAGSDKARQRELWDYLGARVRDSFRELDDFDYDAYWIATASDPRDRDVRRAALNPLANIAADGAVLWVSAMDRQTRTVVKTAAEVTKRFRTPRKDDGAGGSRFYETPSVLPVHCDGSCCRYRLTQTTPCTAGGGPDNFILYRACFDASGATTDLFVAAESEADPIYHPDAP